MSAPAGPGLRAWAGRRGFGPPGTRLARGCAVVAALLCAPHAKAQAPAAPGAPRLAVLRALDGTLPDSANVGDFWASFRGTFTLPSLATERPSVRAGRYALSVPVPNRFALLEGPGSELNRESYGVQISIQWLKTPGSRPSARPGAGRRPASKAGAAATAPDTLPPRAVISVLVWPPGIDPAVVRIAPARDTVTFLAPREPRAARAKSIGRNLALLALEQLHRSSEALPADERLQLDRAVRRTAVASLDRPRR